MALPIGARTPQIDSNPVLHASPLEIDDWEVIENNAQTNIQSLLV
jgi:hypothetical protein